MCLSRYAKQYSGYAALFLRLAIGIIFIAHGWQKFSFGIPAIAGFFESIGLPGFMAGLVASVELAGGILLILGLFTRYAALLLSAVMVVAIVKVKLAVGLIAPQTAGMPGMELDLAILAGNLALVVLGAQKLSIDNDVLKREF